MSNIIRKIVLVILIGVFLFSGYQLFNIFMEYQQIEQTVDNVKEEAIVVPEPEEKAFLIIDWDKMKEINSDIIAWIEIPDSNINYPVLKGENNDTYLRHDVNKKYSIGGSIFIEENNNGDFSDPNSVLYGHNTQNGSMFADLLNYVNDPQYYDTHQYIYLYLPDGTVSQYTIFSTHHIDAYSELYNTYQLPSESLLNQGNTVANPIALDGSNQIMLSTCTVATQAETSTARTTVHGQLTRSGIDPTVEKPQ